MFYAVIWSDNNYKSGGSWEPASNFDMLQEFDTDCSGSNAKDTAHGGGDSKDVLEQAAQHHMWARFFGSGLAEGTEILLQWVQLEQQSSRAQKRRKQGNGQPLGQQRYVTEMFKGELGDEFEHPGWLIHYPKAKQCKDYGTAAQRNEEEHLMNLSTMETDLSAMDDGQSLSSGASAEGQHLGGWVLQAYAGLPFVHGPSGLDFKVSESVNAGAQ